MYKGELEGFPTEIVEKMLDEQEKQGNKRDVKCFERDRFCMKYFGGFDWNLSKENNEFWRKLIAPKNFDVFFAKYPKQIELPKVFCISCNVKNPLWEKYIAWLNKTYKREMSGLVSAYYGVTEKSNTDYYFHPAAFGYNTQLLTLEQWYDLFIKPTIQTNKMENSYKFTIDYVNNNKVAIFVKTQSELDGLKKLNCFGHLVLLEHYKSGFYTVPKSGSWFEGVTRYTSDYETTTAKEFIENNSTNKMEKQIIGYKLIKPEYKSAVNTLLSLVSLNFERFETEFQNYSSVILDLNKAGVLDLWFEPVYKTEFKVGDWLICDGATGPKASKVIEINNDYYVTTSSIKNSNVCGYAKDLKGLRIATKEEIAKVNEVIYTMGKSATGTFQLVVRDGKVFHKTTEDITSYVEAIQKTYADSLCNKRFGNYDFTVKDVIISKSGCRGEETLLSQWLAIKL